MTGARDAVQDQEEISWKRLHTTGERTQVMTVNERKGICLGTQDQSDGC